MADFDRTAVTTSFDSALDDLDHALTQVIYAQNELSAFSGESFGIYKEILDNIYNQISNARTHLLELQY